jgi:hypothetical protein
MRTQRALFLVPAAGSEAVTAAVMAAVVGLQAEGTSRACQHAQPAA